MTGYYRTFVKNYSIVAAPLTDLTRLDTPWEWTDECEAAFRHLKHALTHYEVLKLPDLDKPFIVTTDVSQYGIGVVLAQQEGPKLRHVEYMSKKMPSQKLAKSTYEKELYVVYKAPTHWRHYLLGRDVRFTSELWKAAAAEQGTQLEMTSGNHPEANGQAEQLNRAVGDIVWVKSLELGQEYGISHKLMPQYSGPWEVLDIVRTDPDGPSYVIRIPDHLRTYPVFHASKLAPFKETDQFPSRRSMLPPTMDGEMDINDIVDHRELPTARPTGRGRPPKPKLQFRVRFRHHTDPKEDRWFTREELMQTAPQVVAHYEKSLQKGKRPMVED
ncbi:hypothetical protein CBR_g40834 [Chara braunii]|uniref:Uncharacterized protein n=1 Tax=Chara braunii TaxID=69332 RepID=A0A388LUM3_CHABU|nr:hypothetical protein CBR_g40834 [Chara braunii]|eukprot:GBG86020.1 hypothetical protein CBR_g40834 [Chara braunii]